ESAVAVEPGGITVRSVVSICWKKKRIRPVSTSTHAKISSAGKNVRIDEYAAPFACMKMPCWRAPRQKALRNRFKCEKNRIGRSIYAPQTRAKCRSCFYLRETYGEPAI